MKGSRKLIGSKLRFKVARILTIKTKPYFHFLPVAFPSQVETLKFLFKYHENEAKEG